MVSGVFGRWMDRKSARATRSSIDDTSRTPSWRRGRRSRTGRRPRAACRTRARAGRRGRRPARGRRCRASCRAARRPPTASGSTRRREVGVRPAGRCGPARATAQSCARRRTARSTAARSPPSRRGGWPLRRRRCRDRCRRGRRPRARARLRAHWRRPGSHCGSRGPPAPPTASSSSSCDIPVRTSTSSPAARMASRPVRERFRYEHPGRHPAEGTRSTLGGSDDCRRSPRSIGDQSAPVARADVVEEEVNEVVDLRARSPCRRRLGRVRRGVRLGPRAPPAPAGDRATSTVEPVG